MAEVTGDTAGAVAAYLQAVQVEPTHASTLAVAGRLALLAPVDPDAPSAQRVRIAIIGSSSCRMSF